MKLYSMTSCLHLCLNKPISPKAFLKAEINVFKCISTLMVFTFMHLDVAFMQRNVHVVHIYIYKQLNNNTFIKPTIHNLKPINNSFNTVLIIIISFLIVINVKGLLCFFLQSDLWIIILKPPHNNHTQNMNNRDLTYVIEKLLKYTCIHPFFLLHLSAVVAIVCG